MREFLTPDRFANQIRLLKDLPAKSGTTFLLLEGTTDENVYKYFIDKSVCQIIVMNNKNMAIQVLTILEKDSFVGILAILDADFDVLEGKFPSSQNLLFTDTHDLEMMMAKSPALEKVLSVFASQKKMDAFINTYGQDIRSKLLSCAMHVGYLRWVSLRENFSLNFNDLNFGDFMKDPLIVDTAKLINLLRSRSYGTTKSKLASPPTNSDIHSKLQILMDDTHDQWYVCCGHDIIGILSLWLRKLLGDQKEQSVRTEFLEICLRLAYERPYFAKTQLYAAIRLWEQNNAPFIVLSAE